VDGSNSIGEALQGEHASRSASEPVFGLVTLIKSGQSAKEWWSLESAMKQRA